MKHLMTKKVEQADVSGYYTCTADSCVIRCAYTCGGKCLDTCQSAAALW